MKIASETRLILSLPALALGFVLTSSAHAADTSLAATFAATTPAAPAPSEMAVPAAPGVAPFAATSTTPPDSMKAMNTLGDKTVDAAKGIVKQLSSADNVTLDDLNAARQMVAKLEAMIDVQKHIVEYEKLKNDRPTEKLLASSLPASALTPMPMVRPMPMMPAGGENAAFGGGAFGGSATEVTRISGAAGNYTAMIQGKTYHVGDKLSNGEVVTAIAADQVSLKGKDGAVKVLKVKGVDSVYGRAL